MLAAARFFSLFCFREWEHDWKHTIETRVYLVWLRSTCTSSWTCCCVRWHGINQLSQFVLYFSSFLFFSVRLQHSPFVRWKTKRNHIQSGKKWWTTEWKKKHWWQFQTLDDVWYACDKKNTIYSNVLTHAFYNISSINVPFGWVAHWRWCVVRFLKTSWHWVCVGSSCECGRVEAPNTKRWFLAYSGFFCDFDDGLMRELKPRTHESWVRK